MGWLEKMSKKRFGEAIFETDKTLTPFTALKVSKKGIDEGGSILFA